MLVRIKIVPNSEPNADGEWIEKDVPRSVMQDCNLQWIEASERLAPHVPEGFHCVAWRMRD